jgi:hypothetical protein
MRFVTGSFPTPDLPNSGKTAQQLTIRHFGN